jgi:hypothetical protein
MSMRSRSFDLFRSLNDLSAILEGRAAIQIDTTEKEASTDNVDSGDSHAGSPAHQPRGVFGGRSACDT